MPRIWVQARPLGFAALLFIAPLLAAGSGDAAPAPTLEAAYPGLAAGMLKAATLEPMSGDTVFVSDGVKIGQAELLNTANQQDPKLRTQLQQNLLFVLEQEAARRILLNEAKKAGVATDKDDNKVIQALFERKVAEITVSPEEAKAFYQANREMVGEASFEQVAGEIQKYLLQDKRQKAVASFVESLGRTVPMRLSAEWVKSQSSGTLNNPVDKARRSNTPTMVEFGATGCVPCDMMQPILENLRKNYPNKLNVVFVHVGEEQVLAARYGIRSIPVQVFFDAKGREVFRHVGFFAAAEVTKQLEKIGVVK
jgi:thiol-disulfide isomerase/thioredoxin